MPCTCGSAVAVQGETRGHYDITAWCREENHRSCSGKLMSATGSHWFCICTCHKPPNPIPGRDDWARAIATYHEARKRAGT